MKRTRLAAYHGPATSERRRPDNYRQFDYDPPSGDPDDIDLLYEMLCCLSPQPKPLAEIAGDMRITRPEARKIALMLRQAGLGVVVRRLHGAGDKATHHIHVAPESWAVARREAETYWDSVWDRPAKENAA